MKIINYCYLPAVREDSRSFLENKTPHNMAKTLNILKWCVNIILGLGSWLAVSENPNDLTPNFIGLACFFLLIIINRKDERAN